MMFTRFSIGAALCAALACPIAYGQVADSIADFPAPDNVSSDSKQGINNWTYGYHVDPLAAGFSYTTGSFINFPDNAGPGTSPTDFWTGSTWDWHAGNPPWTFIGSAGGHPNGGPEHWAIRRWESEVNGAADVTFSVNKTNTAGGGNNGVTARLFVNGTQQGAIPIAPTDGTGKTWTVHVPNLQAGDLVDVALDPTGPVGPNANLPHDGSDGSNFSAVVNQVSPYPTRLVADSIADFSGNQGQAGWFNGYHNVTANGGYDATPGGTDDFIEFGAGGDAGFAFDGTKWDWSAGNPPWTEISATGGHPNTGGDDHWAIRRFVVDDPGFTGEVWLEAFLAKSNTGGGDGTLLHVFHNGTEIDTPLSVAGTDGVGFTNVFAFSGVEFGDFIDIALDPNVADGSDGSFFSAQIFVATPEPASIAIWALLGAAVVSIPFARRFRRKR